MIFGLKAIQQDAVEIEKQTKEMMLKRVYPIENKNDFRGLKFVPIYKNRRQFIKEKSGEELVLNEMAQAQTMVEITNIEDLE